MLPNGGRLSGGRLVREWILLLVCLPLLSLHAHAPNTSYLRCAVEPHRLELTFSFDMDTLFRVIGYNINAKGSVSRADMEGASPDVYRFLEDTVQLQINGKPVSLGQRQPMGWPADGGSAIEEKDYQQKLLHFHYLQDSQPLVEDLTITYNVFNELGADHRVVSIIQQSGKHLEVLFTQQEPDYLFDTYWRNEPRAEPLSISDSKEHFRSAVLFAWHHPEFLLMALLLLLKRSWWLVVVGPVLLGVALSTLVVTRGDPVAALGAWLGGGVFVLAAAPPVLLFQQYRHKKRLEAFKSLQVSAETA